MVRKTPASQDKCAKRSGPERKAAEVIANSARREAKLAEALRANLRRRKASGPTGVDKVGAGKSKEED